MSILISPSILNSDIGNLAGELDKISGADWAHVDVMDNHFVPNLTWGLPVIEAAKKYSSIPIDAHLMIEDPDRWAPAYIEAGAASATFHAEAVKAPIRLAREIRGMGGRAGLALSPATQIDNYIDILDEFDMVLCMTVEPGFWWSTVPFLRYAEGGAPARTRQQEGSRNLDPGRWRSQCRHDCSGSRSRCQQLRGRLRCLQGGRRSSSSNRPP